LRLAALIAQTDFAHAAAQSCGGNKGKTKVLPGHRIWFESLRPSQPVRTQGDAAAIST
jgi:hypothetical protein